MRPFHWLIRMIAKLVGLAAFLIIVLAGGYYVATNIQVRNSIFQPVNTISTPTAITSTYSTKTYTTTQTTSCTTNSQTTQTTTSTTSESTSVTTLSSAVAVQSSSFTYSPQSPAEVQSVQAIVDKDQNGDSFVYFSVVFMNNGNAPVYVTGGCGGTLSATIVSPMAKQIRGGPLCECMEFIGSVNPGQNHTAITPGCWSGYRYELTGSGTMQVILTLDYYSSSTQSSGTSDSTTIEATFNF
jgi:hypothetical protein